MVFGWVGEDSAYIYFAWVAFQDGGGEFLDGGEGLVTDVDFISGGWFDGEGKFTVGESVIVVRLFGFVRGIVGRLLGQVAGWVVGEPGVEEVEGKEAGVVLGQEFGGEDL